MFNVVGNIITYNGLSGREGEFKLLSNLSKNATVGSGGSDNRRLIVIQKRVDNVSP
jgi:hypothetical protein